MFLLLLVFDALFVCLGSVAIRQWALGSSPWLVVAGVSLYLWVGVAFALLSVVLVEG